MPHIIFALITLAAVCLTIVLVGECKMGKRMHKVQACVEFDSDDPSYSHESVEGMRCESVFSGGPSSPAHITCCTP